MPARLAAPRTAASFEMIVGVDGCRGGWCVVRRATEDASIELTVVRSFAEILESLPTNAVVAVDMPIGLVEQGERECDLLARRLLAPHRSSSIFSSPLRSVLAASTHTEASQRRFERDGKRMSIQAYNILPKVREVDEALRHSRTDLAVHEVHPELSFAHMNAGAPLQQSKKTADGREARLALLRERFGREPERLLGEVKRAEANVDDVLDALAALWSAQRLARGIAHSLPAAPLLDSAGLRMAIHY